MRRRYALVLVVFWCAMSGLALYRSGLPIAHAANAQTPPQTAGTPSSEFIKGLQRELKRAGYDPGATDGKMGPTTRRALKRFQEAQGLPPSGDADIPTLTKLLGKDLPR
jgi:peptidoglycan hydrolase-like protein with peptidoglycan-binding domain